MPSLLARLLLTAPLWLLPALPASAAQTALQAIEATTFDYIDGQLEGDVARVTRVLHPDLAKRTPKPDSPHETLGLSRMTSDELIRYTREGALKTPREQWRRSVEVLRVDEDIATVRVESPWFIDHLQLARLDGRWVVVNALWRRKPRT